MGLLVVGLILFLLLVILHELGHFIAARRGGVDIEEFGIGFPPRLFGINFKNNQTPWGIIWHGFIGLLAAPFGGDGAERKLKSKDIPDDKKTVYTVNLLPLGGFVRLKGEHDGDTEKGSFGAAPLKTKVKIMLAGVGVNLAIAWFMLLLLTVIGIPQLPLPGDEKQFVVASDAHTVSAEVYAAYVEPNSPAEKAGLQTRDKIKNIAAAGSTESTNSAVKNADELIEKTGNFAGQEAAITVDRDGEIKQLTAALRGTDEVEASRQTDDPKGYLGVVPYDYQIVRSTWSAPVVATGLTYQYTKITLQGLGGAIKNLFTGNAAEAGENVSGPVGIFFVLKDGSTLGFRYVLLIIALLSLTLAIMNTLPIPALDGGRLFVTLLFRALKKPLTPRMEERIHGSGFAALMLLFVVITVVDVRRFF